MTLLGANDIITAYFYHRTSVWIEPRFGANSLQKAAPASGALRVFISYSRDDQDFALRVFEALKKRGLDPQIDTRNLPKLEDWRRELLGFIREADAIVFIISPRSIASPACAWEIEQVASLNKRLAPIVLERVPDDRIPQAAAKINYLFFDEASDFETQADELGAALQSDVSWLKEHTRLGERGRRWNEGRKSGAHLLRGQELLEAETWIAARPRNAPEPTELHRAFIQQSRRGATRRRNGLVAALSLGLVVAVSLAGLAYRQSMIAEEQRAQVTAREMDRRAALAQDLSTRGKPGTASAVALDALRTVKEANEPATALPGAVRRAIAAVGGMQNEAGPTRSLISAIERALDLVRIPKERYFTDNVLNLALSPDGRLLAAGTNTSKIHLLNAETLESKFELQTGEDIVSGLQFSPDGNRLVSSGDKVPEVWDVKTGQKLLELQRTEAKGHVYQVHYSPDGTQILATSGQNAAYIYNANDGKLLHVLRGATFDEMWDRLANSDTANEYGAADPIANAVSRATFQIWGATTDGAFNSDGTLVAVTGPANPDGSVRLFNTATGKLVRTLTGGKGATMLPPLGYGSKLSFSPDGTRLVAAPLERTIKIWNVADGSLLREYPTAGINSFQLTADGSALVSAHADGAIIFRCLTENASIASLQAHEGGVESLTVDSEGKLLATGGTDRTARVWRMPTGKEVCRDDRHGSPNGEIALMRPASVLGGHGARITKAAFSADKTMLYTASQDGWVRAWPIGAPADVTVLAINEAVEPENSWDSSFGEPVISADGEQIFILDSRETRWHGWSLKSRQALEISDDIKALAPLAEGSTLR